MRISRIIVFTQRVRSYLYFRFIKKDFENNGICVEHCPAWEANTGKSFLDSFPVSTVLINHENGSRTIVHSKGDIPELSLENFKALDLMNYSWIHFEGRNIEEITKMMSFIKTWRDKNCNGSAVLPKISVELEKPKHGLISLAKYADVVFLSKDFALYHGWNGMESAIEGLASHVNDGAIIVCTWGELGSSAICLPPHDNKNLEGPKMAKELFYAPIYPPSAVVDTLGAGDTFVAGFIRAFSSQIPLSQALEFASRLAGAKVGTKGFSSIRGAYLDIIKYFPEINA